MYFSSLSAAARPQAVFGENAKKRRLFLGKNHRKNVQNRVQYLSKSSKLENVNNLFIILQQHCQFCLPLLPKNNNSICSIQKINKFV